MIVGVLSCEFFLPCQQSLKGKRGLIKSLTARLKNKFNVSVAEVGFLDKWQRSLIAIACVSGDTASVKRQLNIILKYLDKETDMELLEYTLEII